MKTRHIAIVLSLLSVPANAADVTLKANDWDIQYSQGVPSHPTNPWQFNFPRCSKVQGTKCGVDYINTPKGPKLKGASAIAMTFIVTGNSPEWIWETNKPPCNRGASVYLFFQQGNALDNNEFHRWWSVQPFPLSVTAPMAQNLLSVQLDPSKWLSVFGKVGNSSSDATKGFNKALANASRIGMTFGGGCNAGHGVAVKSGSAAFKLLNYQVMP